MAYRTRLVFRKTTSPGNPHLGDVVFYVDSDANLVKVEEDGTETIVGTGAADVTVHEEAADPHPQYIQVPE
jgi:hypothetical protein